MPALRITGRTAGQLSPLNSNFYVAHPCAQSEWRGLPRKAGALLWRPCHLHFPTQPSKPAKDQDAKHECFRARTRRRGPNPAPAPQWPCR
jgi:hypothetical protein